MTAVTQGTPAPVGPALRADRPRRPPVVLVGLGSLVGLQTARLLHARGVDVYGLTADPRHYAARTNACREVIECDVHSPDFLDTLAELGPRLGGAVLLPCTDRSALTLARDRERVERWFAMALPGYDTLHRLADKARFHQTARELGISVPRTVVVSGTADLMRAGAQLELPVVLKPTIKSKDWQSHAPVKAVRCQTVEELWSAYRQLSRWSQEMVVQEFVGGPDSQLCTVNCYYSTTGAPLVTFTTRKHRQWPPEVGIASFASEHEDPELVTLAHRLFGALGFVGLGYLEAKRDPRTGELRVLEANVGRPTGRSATAETAGVEMLATMYADAAGLPIPAEDRRRQQFRGACWVDGRRDVLAAAHEWRAGRVRVGQVLGEWRRPLTAHAVWSRRDPWPFLLDLRRSAAALVGSLRRRWSRPVRG